MEKIKYIILEQLLNEGRKEDAMRKYPKVSQSLVDYLSSIDPSGNNKYLMWLVRQIDSGLTNLTQAGDFEEGEVVDLDKMMSKPITKDFLESLKDNILCFHQNVDRISAKNVDQMIDKISEVTADFDESKIKSNPKDINSYPYLGALVGVCEFFEELKPKTASRIKLYEDSRWLVVVPLTHNASCSYGIHSNWCVSTSNETFFKRYTQDAFLIFFLDKQGTNPKKPDANEYKFALNVNFEKVHNLREWEWYDMEDSRVSSILMMNILPKEILNPVINYMNEVLDESTKDLELDTTDLENKTLAFSVSENTPTTKEYTIIPDITNLSDYPSIKESVQFLKTSLDKIRPGDDQPNGGNQSIIEQIVNNILSHNESGYPYIKIRIKASPTSVGPNLSVNVPIFRFSTVVDKYQGLMSRKRWGGYAIRTGPEGIDQVAENMIARSLARIIFNSNYSWLPGLIGGFTQEMQDKVFNKYCDMFNKVGIKLRENVYTNELKVGDTIEVDPPRYGMPPAKVKVVRVAEKSIALSNGKRMVRNNSNRKTKINDEVLRIVPDEEIPTENPVS